MTTTIEVLYFASCPHAEPALAQARLVAASEPGCVVLETLVNEATVEELRFLGSPSLRVDGRDVEPGASERTDFGYSCRRYETRAGMIGVPLEEWVRIAVLEARGPRPLLEGARTCGCSPDCWCRHGWRRRLRWVWPARHMSL